MAIMQSCCCLRSVRRGSFACAIYTVLYYSLIAVTIATVLQEESQYLAGNRKLPKSNSILEPEMSPITMRFNIALLICSSCGVVCCLLLLYGLFKDEKLFLLPWICTVIACSIVDVSHLIYLFFFVSPDVWVVHGLWPHKLGGKSPKLCDKQSLRQTIRFRNEVSRNINTTLEQRLDKNWPLYNQKRSIQEFWYYEWDKHGSCLKSNENLDNVPKYFGKALELLDKYNIGQMLKKYGIVPGEDYTYDNIYQVISFEYNVMPSIKCIKDGSQSKRQYLLKVLLCFDKKLNLENCNNNNVANSCDEKENITYSKM